MASTIVRALLPPGSGTVTLNLYEPGSTTLANTGGDTATEGTGGKGYEWTVTEALAGLYLARLLDSGGSEIGSGAVVLADDAGPYYLGDPVSVSSASQASVDALAGNGDTIDGHTTIGALRLMLAAMVGKLSGASGTSVAIRAADDSKDRITATVDAYGNRSAVTLDDT